MTITIPREILALLAVGMLAAIINILMGYSPWLNWEWWGIFILSVTCFLIGRASR